MNSRSIKVPQPQFCKWVKKRRLELGLSRAELKGKIGLQISDRTLIYLEDKRDFFSEFTLSIFAKGHDLTFSDLLERISELDSRKNKPVKFSITKSKIFIFSTIILFFQINILFIVSKIRKGDFLGDENISIQDVQNHPEYPKIILGFDKAGNQIWQNNLKTRIKKGINF
jgi:hypothetical protein